MLQEATPLFIAACYSQVEVVQWLLSYGADRTSKCYLGKTALDFVGECWDHSVLRVKSHLTGRTDQPITKTPFHSVECLRVLQLPPLPPSPPALLTLSSHCASQVIKRNISEAGGMALTTTITKCILELVWQTPCSNGAIIDKYEIRYRIVNNEDTSDDESEGEDQEANGNGNPESEQSQDPDIVQQEVGEQVEEEQEDAKVQVDFSWRTERVTHCRKVLMQSALMEDFQFGTRYEFAVRSWNQVGRSEWSKLFQYQTIALPPEEKLRKMSTM